MGIQILTLFYLSSGNMLQLYCLHSSREDLVNVQNSIIPVTLFTRWTPGANRHLTSSSPNPCPGNQEGLARIWRSWERPSSNPALPRRVMSLMCCCSCKSCSSTCSLVSAEEPIPEKYQFWVCFQANSSNLTHPQNPERSAISNLFRYFRNAVIGMTDLHYSDFDFE